MPAETTTPVTATEATEPAPDIQEIRRFLATCPPFDYLPDEEREHLCHHVVVQRIKADTPFIRAGEVCQAIHLIRSGSVASEAANGAGRVKHLIQGDVFGVVVPPEGEAHDRVLRTLEDTILYQIPRPLFGTLCDAHPPFSNHFVPIDESFVRGSLLRETEHCASLPLITSPVRTLCGEQTLLIEESTSIREVAQRMDRLKQGCALLVRGNTLSGILTDHDLRSRVVAQGHEVTRPVREVMSPNPVTLEAKALGIDAALLMTRLGIEHIPILEEGRPIGVVTAKDLSQSSTASAIYLVRDAYLSDSLEGLKKIANQIPTLLADLANAWMPAHGIGHLISSVTDAMNIRLLQLAEAKLGPPPVPYNWVVVGSLGRCEQTAVSDQDNFILLDDAYDVKTHGPYFEKLATRVCAGMNALGYVYCPGGIMAQTVSWRQPLSVWKGYFGQWIQEPQPKALMLSCIFFDLRRLYGQEALFRNLDEYITQRSRENQLYLTHMAANALSSHPPLGFFNHFVLVRGGAHNRTLNLKQNGVIPIVDLARIYALSSGNDPVNTVDRLKWAAECHVLSREGAQDLLDAFELISITRLRHQARLIRENKKISHYLPPNLLTNMEQGHLKDAFAITRTMQASLRQTFSTDAFC